MIAAVFPQQLPCFISCQQCPPSLLSAFLLVCMKCYFIVVLICVSLNPLQCSCLKNPRDRGAWWAAVYGPHRVGHDWSELAAAAVTNDTELFMRLLTTCVSSVDEWLFKSPAHFFIGLFEAWKFLILMKPSLSIFSSFFYFRCPV